MCERVLPARQSHPHGRSTQRGRPGTTSAQGSLSEPQVKITVTAGNLCTPLGG
jgi:hypothetical protein